MQDKIKADENAKSLREFAERVAEDAERLAAEREGEWARTGRDSEAWTSQVEPARRAATQAAVALRAAREDLLAAEQAADAAKIAAYQARLVELCDATRWRPFGVSSTRTQDAHRRRPARVLSRAQAIAESRSTSQRATEIGQLTDSSISNRSRRDTTPCRRTSRTRISLELSLAGQMNGTATEGVRRASRPLRPPSTGNRARRRARG